MERMSADSLIRYPLIRYAVGNPVLTIRCGEASPVTARPLPPHAAAPEDVFYPLALHVHQHQ